MKIIKRNGQEEDFSAEKIMRVIRLANNSVLGTDRIPSDEKIQEVYDFVMKSLSQFGTVSVETIQDKIRDAFMNFNYFEVANSFITFRENKKAQKKYTETEEKIITVCDYTNEAVKQDNANKNPRVLSVQRDYIAGTCCKAIAEKKLPKDIIDFHKKGLGHYHDMDYSPLQKMSNCCLVYMKDAFENGFELNGTPIHRTTKGFKTDCTLASQVAPQVSGQQYGGQTMSWAHIARSVDISRMRFINELLDEGELEDYGIIGPKYDMYEGLIENYKVLHYDYDEISVEQVYTILANLIPETKLNKFKHRVEIRVNREIADGVKTFQYQVLTILCSNGQTPFISMSMNLEDCEGDTQWEADTKKVFEEVLRQRIKGLPDRHGNLVPVVFPKLLYFLDENNHEEGTENWYLTKLAAESAAKTMAPDFISAKVQKKVKHTNHTWPCMGCRSFATPYTPDPLYDDEVVKFNRGYKDTITVKGLYELSKTDPKGLKYRMFLRAEGYYKGDVNEIDHFEEENGRIKLVCRPKYWGFFNGGVVTINVPHVALESHGNKAEFWRILDQRCEIAYRALVERYKSLKDAPSDAAPMLRQFGGLMRLKDNENWNHFIVGPRCTYSLGYVGLWETQLYMTGKKLTEDQSFANEILNFFNKKHEEWHTRLMDPKDPNSWLNTSTYGTPEENLVQKFSDALKRDFGHIEGITDHDYVTNSYHIDPAANILWADKICIESKMMDKSTGGAISYIELPDMSNNLKAVEDMVSFMYDHILYCEINVKRDICYRCGFRGVIKLVKDNGKRVWECPACRNRDTSQMFIRRRVCGYIGDANTGAAQSRMADYEARREHADVPIEDCYEYACCEIA